MNMLFCARFAFKKGKNGPDGRKPRHKNPQKAGVNHMSNRNKRKDPMPKLIVAAVLLVALAVAAFVLSDMFKDYRADKLAKMQQAVKESNEEKYAAYEQEVAEYKESLEQPETNTGWPAAKDEGFDIVDLTNYPLQIPGTVTVSRADIMNNGLLLVNEWHSRPEDFDESAITSLSGYARNSGLDPFWSSSSNKLFPVAIDALVAALTDAKAVGLENYVVDYSYRTYDEQQALFDKAMASYESRYSGDALIARTKREINYPGTSEYNTGLSFTLYTWRKDDSAFNNLEFVETEQGKWFYENSWKYGIIFRFPKANYPYSTTTDKSYKTGVSRGIDCYRYVGVPHATIMHHLDLCLEEYIEYLMDHPHFAVYQDGKLLYEITRQQVGDDVATFSVDITRKNTNYTMYLDNMGGVVTVYSY